MAEVTRLESPASSTEEVGDSVHVPTEFDAQGRPCRWMAVRREHAAEYDARLWSDI